MCKHDWLIDFIHWLASLLGKGYNCRSEKSCTLTLSDSMNLEFSVTHWHMACLPHIQGRKGTSQAAFGSSLQIPSHSCSVFGQRGCLTHTPLPLFSCLPRFQKDTGLQLSIHDFMQSVSMTEPVNTLEVIVKKGRAERTRAERGKQSWTVTHSKQPPLDRLPQYLWKKNMPKLDFWLTQIRHCTQQPAITLGSLRALSALAFIHI